MGFVSIEPDKYKKYFECSCGCELITMSKDMEFGEVYMSMYSLGTGGRRSLKAILYHIKRILSVGEPYADSIVFDEKEFLRFRDFVNDIALWRVTEFSPPEPLSTEAEQPKTKGEL